MKGRKKEPNTLLRQYLKFAAATVASQLVYSLYSLVDGLFVSRGVNEYAMSAVNLALPYTNALFSVAVLFAVGTGTIIAVFLGQGKPEEASRLFSQNLAVLTGIGLLLTVILLCFLDPFTKLLGANELTWQYTRDYLRGLAPFSLCFIISYNMEVLIKTDGFPQKALRTVLFSALCNCVLDYAAIFLLDMGVFGAALATGISQLFGCILYFIHFLGKKTTFRLRRFRFDLRIYRRLIPLGISDGATEICNGLMIFLFNRVILRCLGSDGLVSYAIIAYLNTIVINSMIGASAAAQPLVSFRHGTGETASCRALLRYALRLAAGMEGAVMLLLILAAKPIVSLFLGPESLALSPASVLALRRYALSYAVLGLNVVIGGYLTARERPWGAMTISLGRGFAVQTPVLLALAFFCGGNTVWFTPLVSELICFFLSLLFLRNSRKADRLSA